MKKRDLENFFSEVSEEISEGAELFLTGGILAWFYGGVRPTRDIDFALKTYGKWEEVTRSLNKISQRKGIPLEYSEDISRWGSIGYSRFTEGAKIYKDFGKLKVFLLDPIVWSIGKLSRYTADDLSDLVAVFKNQKPDPQQAILIWSKALLESPRSSEHHLFIRKIEDFLSHHGKEIWGENFDAQKVFKVFKSCLK